MIPFQKAFESLLLLDAPPPMQEPIRIDDKELTGFMEELQRKKRRLNQAAWQSRSFHYPEHGYNFEVCLTGEEE